MTNVHSKMKAPPASRAKKPTKKVVASPRSSGGGTAEQRLLSAIKTASILKKTDAPSRDVVASIAGFPDAKSSTVKNSYTKLKVKKFIVLPDSSTVSLTEAGSKAAGFVSVPTSNEAIQAAFREKLSGLKSRQIFDTLIDGQAMDRETVAKNIGCGDVKSSTFKNAMTPLRKLGLLEDVEDPANPKNKLLQLTDAAFPFKRPGCGSSDSIVSDGMSD